MPTRLPNKRKLVAVPVAAGGIAIGAAIGALAPDALVDKSVAMFKDQIAAVGLVPSCNIKGNISIDTGERIYHVPGQMYYNETVISPRFGERWFCSEAEARAAGWRKARR